MYEAERDPYLYDGTAVLRNLFDIRDETELEVAERLLTRARAEEGLPAGLFDYRHYKAIHRHLFQDIYEWAGVVRTVNLAKGGSAFCRIEFIDGQMTKLFDELKKENLLRALDLSVFAGRAAHYLGELNAIHPFREGNGRTQNAFLELLMAQAGHARDFSSIDPKELLSATIQSFHGDTKPLADLIRNMQPL